MGLMDRVKEQAGKARSQAQDLKGKAVDKVEEVQGKRKADDLLAELGRLLFAERTDRPQPGADAEVQRIVAELKGLEADGLAIVAVAVATPTAEAPPAAPPVTPAATPPVTPPATPPVTPPTAPADAPPAAAATPDSPE